MTALKSLLFFLLVPGLLLGLFPWWMSQSDIPLFEPGPLRSLAVPLWLLGAAGMVWCFWDFVQKGKGTPAPIEPPKELVVSGLYRYVRNPMYVGVLLVILGHFLWFGFWNLLIYAALVFLAFNSFVVFYEEPNLKQRFGATYDEYLKRVPRWIPRRQ